MTEFSAEETNKPSLSTPFPLPFENVVITFPDETAATWVRQGPLCSWMDTPVLPPPSSSSASSNVSMLAQPHAVATQPTTGVQWLASTDPYGARVGSGGGTLAALDLVQSSYSTPSSSSPATTTTSLPRVLILHAGGESSRCPTQMVLGKAWTSLPTRTRLCTPLSLWLDNFGRQDLWQTLPAGSIVVVASDTLIDFPMPSSSTMNSNNSNGSLDWATLNPSSVVGLAVPAPVETVQNHGVFILPTASTPPADDLASKDGGGGGNYHLGPCAHVLQKPDVATMRLYPQGTFFLAPSNTPGHETVTAPTPLVPDHIDHSELTMDSHQDPEEMAWIDTGVIVFLPAAAQALVELSKGPLQACTWSGLKRLFQKQEPEEIQDFTAGSSTEASPPEKDRLSIFASQHAVKIDLYTHLLQALALYGDTTSLSERQARYCAQHQKDLPDSMAQAVFEALSSCPLHILACPGGRFLHLGTTRELQDFMVYGCAAESPLSSASPVTIPRRRRLCQHFGQSLQLTRRLDAFAALGSGHQEPTEPALAIQPSAVLSRCLLVSTAVHSCRIGAKSVLEHCYVDTHVDRHPPHQPTAAITVGSDCLVSGVRSPSGNLIDPLPDGLCIPNGIMLQMLPLARDRLRTMHLHSILASSESQLFVYMVLGMDDNIKKSERLFGKPLKEFLTWAGLRESDLWDESASAKSLWTARLHPIASDKNHTFGYFYSWLSNYCSDHAADDSLAHWKSSVRLSLCEIRDAGCAATEFAYREQLPEAIRHRKSRQMDDIVDILITRQHMPVYFRFVIDNFAATGEIQESIALLQKLDIGVRNALLTGKFDIGGRICLIISSVLLELGGFAVGSNKEYETIDVETRNRLQQSLQSISRPSNSAEASIAIYEAISKIRDDVVMERFAYDELAGVFESVARCMTKACVCSTTFRDWAQLARAPIYGKWVLATAPVRIDLAGGWSDTPPICFEFGSKVIGAAITIDGKKPLSCRCRILENSEGILLRTEQRDGAGALLSAAEVELTSLAHLNDYCDPNAANCALLKCALVCLGMIPPEKCIETDGALQPYIDSFCRSRGPVRLEVISTSLVPQGSGLGTSSILGGCVLAAIARCIGIDTVHMDSLALIDLVLVLEQHLTTGGGFQDQVNGLIGGIKSVTCAPLQFPIQLCIEQIRVERSQLFEFESQLAVAFTGKTRLAKNILSGVLSRWSQRTPEIVKTVEGLLSCATDCNDGLVEGDWDKVGKSVSDYWELKKLMAGPHSGVEPILVQDLVTVLRQDGLIRGATLCGAGGGGFLAVLLSSNASLIELNEALRNVCAQHGMEDDIQLFQGCRICEKGLTISLLDDAEVFDIGWLKEQYQ